MKKQIKKKRVAIVVSHPIQQFVHLYKALSNDDTIDLKVFFASSIGVKPYFDKDMKVFDISFSTFAGGWAYKRKCMKIQMDVCEKENKYDYWLQTPDIPYIDMYSLKKEGILPEITKEEIFDKIIHFFKIACNKKQIRDIILTELLSNTTCT